MKCKVMQIEQITVLLGSFGAPTKPSGKEIQNLHLANNLFPVRSAAAALHTLLCASSWEAEKRRTSLAASYLVGMTAHEKRNIYKYI